jgi:hypothetical protein
MTLRYGLAELLIVQPGSLTYSPAPPADAPHVADALAWAAGDGEPGELFGDVGRREVRERLTVFGNARHPERLTAPPPVAIELSLSAAELLVAALAGPIRGPRAFLVRFPPVAAASLALGAARRRAERASARRLGVTATTAPHARYGFHLIVLVALVSAIQRWRRGGKRPARAWTRRASTKNGTPWMPIRRASASSSRTASA